MVIFALNSVSIDLKICIVSRYFDVYGTCHSTLRFLIHEGKKLFLKTNAPKIFCSAMNFTYKIMRKEKFGKGIVLAKQNIGLEEQEQFF